MRKIYLAALFLSALSLVGITSCKKNKNNDVSPNAITLDAPKVAGNLITLSWSKLANDSLTAYIVVRVMDTTNIQSTRQFIVDKSKTTFTDSLPMTPYVQYYVAAETPSKVIKSNKQTSVRSDISFMNMVPKDAIFDRAGRKIYIYSTDGKMALYDVASKTISKQINMDATIGYCALANYNGNLELYVPRTDGWLFIYNAVTMEQIDQINVGYQLQSVTTDGDKLFIVTSDYAQTVVCYSRSSKSKISSAYASDIKRLKLVPGTTSEFYAVGGYAEATYLKYDPSGNFISRQTKDLSYNYMNYELFEIFPDGNKFISGNSGVIVDKNLTLVSTLPHGSIIFWSFDFDNTNNLIYAGCNTKTIQAYSLSNYQLTRTVNTLGIPRKIFYDNGTLISISITEDIQSSYYYPIYSFVEQF